MTSASGGVWLQDDAAQFFKEEIEEGVAVYNVYLKKVHYHTSINDVSRRGVLFTCKINPDFGEID